eukprot:CAMPEP_0172861154 /NCGR_PEP_ID=MMETSP1075-20121228/72498_1 /TAXON_ID=2916 /ORGANISM="Ceratium fusus, Strain PA161109" /LENGTH=147 /DNA_ID=CAMNT_0013709265 /DNA_START=65 /DNA_END=508 /DNA_ORIENTATION=-
MAATAATGNLKMHGASGLLEMFGLDTHGVWHKLWALGQQWVSLLACFGSSSCKRRGSRGKSRAASHVLVMAIIFMCVQPADNGPVTCGACLAAAGATCVGACIGASVGCLYLGPGTPAYFGCVAMMGGTTCVAALVICLPVCVASPF